MRARGNPDRRALCSTGASRIAVGSMIEGARHGLPGRRRLEVGMKRQRSRGQVVGSPAAIVMLIRGVAVGETPVMTRSPPGWPAQRKKPVVLAGDHAVSRRNGCGRAPVAHVDSVTSTPARSATRSIKCGSRVTLCSVSKCACDRVPGRERRAASIPRGSAEHTLPLGARGSPPISSQFVIDQQGIWDRPHARAERPSQPIPTQQVQPERVAKHVRGGPSAGSRISLTTSQERILPL